MTQYLVRRFKLHYLFFVIAIICFLAFRLHHAFAAAVNAGPIIDTAVFFDMAKAPFFSTTLFCGLRPPLVPIIYKLLHCNITAIVIFQTFFSSICWTFLACTFVRWIQYPSVKVSSFIIIMLLSLSEPVTVWESALLSESVSISLSIALVGAWFLFVEKNTVQRMSFLLSLSVLWILCRETNSWIMLFTAFVCLPVALYVKNRAYLLIAGALIVSFIVASLSSTIGKRWMFPLLNVISTRILPDVGHVAFFERYGMPVSPALIAMTGECASCKDWFFYKSPDLEQFRQWLDKKGKRTYMLWLMRHPAMTLREPLANITLMITPGSQFHYASPSSRQTLPPFVSKIMFPIGYDRYFSLVLTWLLVFCTGIAVGLQRWRVNRAWVVAILLVLLAYPHIMLVWHGDIVGFEVDRHALAARIQLNCAFWFMACLTIDFFLQRCEGAKNGT